MERQIYAGLRSLGLTLICIAHRPGALAYADKVFNLDESNVALITPPASAQHSRLLSA
jgi:ABC-type bacteriocin/lantibiotic exporter with double-glycine peptidase domain